MTKFKASRSPAVGAAILLALSAAFSAPALAAAQQAETPEEARARLNSEQAAAAKAQLDQNAASKAAYEEAVRAREAEIARIEAETARQKAEYEASMKKWEADVAACNAGDWSRCAKPGQ